MGCEWRMLLTVAGPPSPSSDPFSVVTFRVADLVVQNIETESLAELVLTTNRWAPKFLVFLQRELPSSAKFDHLDA